MTKRSSKKILKFEPEFWSLESASSEEPKRYDLNRLKSEIPLKARFKPPNHLKYIQRFRSQNFGTKILSHRPRRYTGMSRICHILGLSFGHISVDNHHNGSPLASSCSLCLKLSNFSENSMAGLRPGRSPPG